MCDCVENEKKRFAALEEIMAGWNGDKSLLIPLLQELQGAYGYLPEDVIERLSKRTGIFVPEIIGVATFYSQFRLTPIGRHSVKLCYGTACHVNGAETIGGALCDELGVELGETTADGAFTLETVACLGCCSLAPVMMIDGEAYGRLTPAKARAVIKEIREKEGAAK